MTTLQGIRDFARNTLQTDDVDLPNSLVDVYANESLTRILGMRQDWPHLYSEGTLAMVSGTQSYTLASSSFNPQTYTYLQNIWDDGGWGQSLREIDYQDASGYWIGPSNTTDNNPSYFSQYGGKVYIYPKPSRTATLRVGGYRAAAVMVNGTDVPDLPTDFHNGLLYGVAAIAYAQQEDADMAQFWSAMANNSYNAALRTLFFRRVNRPIVYGGRGYATPYISYDEWIRRSAR